MSYTVSITRNELSSADQLAWQQLDQLDQQETWVAATDFISLISQLTERYPCICELPDEKVDEGVWSDGPLVNNAGKNMATLGVVYSQANRVIPFVIETANRMGFLVFDAQAGKIYRPGMPDEVKQSFWKKLFKL